MPVCHHKPAEHTRGAGPCEIRAEIKNRNGTDRHWCFTHGQPAWRPDGEPMERCPGAFFDAIADDRILTVDLEGVGVGVWGALPPAIASGRAVIDDPGVHVHVRPHGGDQKSVDATFQMVRLRYAGQELLVEASAAVAYSIVEMLGLTMVVLRCPKPGCGAVHLDELMFASAGHRKHQCNRCGRPFRDPLGPSISNPLAQAHDHLGLPPRPAAQHPNRSLRIRTDDYDGVAIWPSNDAIVWTSSRPEEAGFHVHAWDAAGDLVVDETYSMVSLDGQQLDEKSLRLLCAQRALAHDERQVGTVRCASCAAPLMTEPDGEFFQPTTRHSCNACGEVTQTARRLFSHPLANTFGRRS